MEDRPQKRFRYATYTQQLKEIQIDKGKGKGVNWDDRAVDEEVGETPLSVELERLCILDLTVPFQAFAKEIRPLSTSLPVILHNLQELKDTFKAFYSSISGNSDHTHSGLDSVLQLHRTLFETSGNEATWILPDATEDLLRLGALPALAPHLVERSYSVLSLILRDQASSLIAADDVLRRTWSLVSEYLSFQGNKPYVRRCVTSAWVGVIRKARGDGLDRLLNLLLVSNPQDGTEAMWAESLQGTAGGLHSRALPILEYLLDRAYQQSVEEHPTSLHKILTATVHHCSSKSLAPVIDAILSRIVTTPSTSGKDSSPGLALMIDLLGTMLLVRKGKRFPEDRLRPSMLKLVEICQLVQSAQTSPSPSHWTPEDLASIRRSLGRATAACLSVSNLAHWLSPGVRLLDLVWTIFTIDEKIAFTSVLLETQWSGFPQFMLSRVLQMISSNIDSNTRSVLNLLRAVSSIDMPETASASAQNQALRRSITSKMISKLQATPPSLSLQSEHAETLVHIYDLLPLSESSEVDILPILDIHLQALLRDLRSHEDVKSYWLEIGPVNSLHVLAALLGSFHRLCDIPGQEIRVKSLLTATGSLLSIIEICSWNADIMEVATALAEKWQEHLSSSMKIDEEVQVNLLSADPKLRKATLTLNSLANQDPYAKEMWNLCLAVEQAEISLKNVRERSTNIKRVARYLQNGVDSDKEVSTTLVTNIIRYLMSQLKVNFRPIYAETIAALGQLATRYADTMWSLIWTDIVEIDLSHPSVPDLGQSSPSWSRPSERDQSSAPREEEDPALLCHNLVHFQGKFNEAWTAEYRRTTEARTVRSALDVLNYEAQLLEVLGTHPQIAEKHSKLLVPHMLHVLERDYSSETLDAHISSRKRQDRAVAYLGLASKFTNPKAAFRSSELHSAYLRVLQTGEARLQKLAIDCILTYKSPSLVPYGDKLRALLDDHKFRDALIHLPLGLESEVVDPQHRQELLPVAIRLLYGIITSRRGRSSTVRNLKARKQAILGALSGCAPSELGTLINLMLGSIVEDTKPSTPRQQIGFLTLLSDVLRLLGAQTISFWPRLVDSVLALIEHAQEQLDLADDIVMDHHEDPDADEEIDEGASGTNGWRNVRTAGIKRLVQWLRSPVIFEWTDYLKRIFASVISPRLDRLEVENSQAPSAILDLIAAIASSPGFAHSLNVFDERTLPKTFACLNSVKVKPAVVLHVFSIIDSLLEWDSPQVGGSRGYLLLPHSDTLIACLIQLVESSGLEKNGQLMPRLLTIISKLCNIVSDGVQAQHLASLLGPMLRQKSRIISERSKQDILQTLGTIYTLCPDFAQPDSDFFNQQYTILANLFQTLSSPSSRQALVAAFSIFSSVDDRLSSVTKWTSDVNAFSAKRPEEPDFDRRLAAYGEINDAELDDLPTALQQWLPLIRTAAFFIREVEELSIRTSASKVLQRFLDVAGKVGGNELAAGVTNVTLPGLRESLRMKHEAVRNEALLVISHAVSVCPAIPILHEMQPLLSDDDQTNFFVNVAHIQVHRRARALRRLRDVLHAHEISEQTVFNLLLPILEHIIAGSTDVTDHHLVNEAISSIGLLGSKLRWARYNALLTRYLRHGSSPSPQQKLYIRTVVSIIENFAFDVKANSGADDIGSDDEQLVEEEAEVGKPIDTLIQDAITSRLLPALARFLDARKEATETIRIPTALAAVKLAYHLPERVGDREIEKIVTTVSQALRSRDQDIRDVARDTMCRIAVFLGPEWLARILKELQTTLQRGPQKHVAAVTTHAILARATTDAAESFGDLDDSVEDAVRISAEVIWGESGKDSQNDDFKTKMREVKSAPSRAFDTFQLLAKLVQPTKIATILAPIREILHVSQAAQSLQQVDEALRRVSSGLNANQRFGTRDILHLCHSLASGTSAFTQQKRKVGPSSQAKDDYRVQMKRDEKISEDYFAANGHKLTTFGLDLFVTAYRRGRLDFSDEEILARLGPLISVIGDSLYSKSSDVLSVALKATAAISRCPLPRVQEALPVYIKNIFSVIKHAGGSAESELVQTALKTLAVILRDCKASKISDAQIRHLLDMVGPDLEEHDRQSAVFAILRAIVSRGFVVPEIYDLMDRVSSIMVTSQSPNVQELSRLTLMQFLLDYPQGKGRLKSQMTFLAQNMEYEFESGRLSVMEVLAAVFRKFSDDVLEDYADLFFVALIAVLANDESEKCRTAAGALVQQLWSRVNLSHQSKWMQIMQNWISEDQSESLIQGSITVFGLICDVDDLAENLLASIIGTTVPLVKESQRRLEAAEVDQLPADQLFSHETAHYLLNTLFKATRRSTAQLASLPIVAIAAHLLYPHDWVRYDAAKLLTTYVTNGDSLKSPSLETENSLFDMARKSCIILGASWSSTHRLLDQKLADQLVKLLYNLAKLWKVADRKHPHPAPGPEVDAEDVQEDSPTDRDPLAWLMSRMSFTARQMIVDRPPVHHPDQWTKPLMSVLRFFAGTFEELDSSLAKRFAVHALAPLYRILDDTGEIGSLEATPDIVELRQFATEVRDSIQGKIGTTQFSTTWDSVRRRVAGKREERRDARNVMAISDPKAWAERRGKRVMLKKESKKRRNKAFAEGKISKGNRRSNH
ncbi:hypothetical protein BD324DRAFT_651653 [Kockovaella imperatae]|uniref:Uncharacterized protein n=1 Tax=Kockovaella imperatae TaxID=4999 RepID=A0A1Y1UED8_9TREE|nr:hypothetical protein BD324DRAFT_651653 [Kockovaella imperatae]ORX36413.1 hypothetical protein BD324DRAFT_651653 [Kockovaella imperatae]